jgi:hypothetical protein
MGRCELDLACVQGWQDRVGLYKNSF